MIEDCTLCGIPTIPRALNRERIQFFRERGVTVTVQKGATIVDQHLMWASAWAQRGYQTALGRYQLEPLPVTTCQPDEVAARLEDVAAYSALVCVGDSLAAAVKEGLIQQGRNIPGEVSLAAMGQPGQLQIQQQSITGYEVQVDHVLDWAIQTLFESVPGERPRDAIVPGRFHDRGSTRSRAHKPTPAKDRHVTL